MDIFEISKQETSARASVPFITAVAEQRNVKTDEEVEEIEEIEDNIQYYKTEIKKDSIKIKELKNDDRVEKYAREKYYMKSDNEDIYIIEFEDEKKAAAEKTTSNN